MEWMTLETVSSTLADNARTFDVILQRLKRSRRLQKKDIQETVTVFKSGKGCILQCVKRIESAKDALQQADDALRGSKMRKQKPSMYMKDVMNFLNENLSDNALLKCKYKDLPPSSEMKEVFLHILDVKFLTQDIIILCDNLNDKGEVLLKLMERMSTTAEPAVQQSDSQRNLKDCSESLSRNKKCTKELMEANQTLHSSIGKLAELMVVKCEQKWRKLWNIVMPISLSSDDAILNVVDDTDVACIIELNKDKIDQHDVTCKIATDELEGIKFGLQEFKRGNILSLSVAGIYEMENPLFLTIPTLPGKTRGNFVPSLRLIQQSKDKPETVLNAKTSLKKNEYELIEFLIDDYKSLDDVFVLVTEQPRIITKAIGPEGGSIKESSAKSGLPVTELKIPPNVLDEKETVNLQVLQNNEKDVEKMKSFAEEGLPFREFGPLGMFNISGPSRDGIQLSLVGPKPKMGTDDVKLMVEVGNGEWHANKYTTDKGNQKYSTTIGSDVKCAVVVVTDQHDREGQIFTLEDIGKSVKDTFRTEMVNLFYAQKDEPVPQILLECCQKEHFEKRMENAKQYGFVITNPPCEDVAMHTNHDGSATFSVEVTGNLSLSTSPVEPKTLDFVAGQNSGRFIDLLLLQPSIKGPTFVGHAIFHIPKKHASFSTKDKSFQLPLTYKKKIIPKPSLQNPQNSTGKKTIGSTFNATTSTIQVEWETDDIYDSYKVKLDGVEAETINASETCYTFTGLPAGKVHRITVVAVTDGQDIEESETVAISKPHKPLELVEVQPKKETEMSVQWKRPEDTEQVDDYEWTVTEYKTKTFRTTGISTDRHTTVSNLKPGTSYHVSVVARTTWKDMIAASEAVEMTIMTKPGCVSSIKCDNITDVSVTISWERSHGCVDKYFYTVFDISSTEKQITSKGETVESHKVLTSLDSGVPYLIEIYSSINELTSDIGTKEFTTRPSVVENLVKLEVTETSVEVTWQPCKGRYDHYNIWIEPNDDNRELPIKIDKSENPVKKFERLTANRMYLISVAAVSGSTTAECVTLQVTTQRYIIDALEILKKDGTMIDVNNLLSLFRMGFELDEGTINNLRHKANGDLRMQLELATAEWQQTNPRNILDLVKALECVPALTRSIESLQLDTLLGSKIKELQMKENKKEK